MDISSLLSPTTTPTPGTGSPTNSTPVSGNPSSPHPFGTSHRNSLGSRRDSHPPPQHQPHALLHAQAQAQSQSQTHSQPTPQSQSQSQHPSSASSLPSHAPAHHYGQQSHHPHNHNHGHNHTHHNHHHQYHHQQPAPPAAPAHHYPSQHTHPHSHQQHTQHPSQQQQQQQQQPHQPQFHGHQSPATSNRPSLDSIRSHSSSALLQTRKTQSPSYYNSYSDVRRESLPIVPEQQAIPPPPPVRHHSLNHLEASTFTSSPLSISTTQGSPLGPSHSQSHPPHPIAPSTNRTNSFSGERPPTSRTASNASQVQMDEERARSEHDSLARRVSRTKSTASIEMMVREATPSPKDAAPEFFSDDEDVDVDMDEDDESTEELGIPEVERLADLIQILDRAYLKDEVDAEDTPPTYNDFLECIGLLRRGFVASKFDINYEFRERLNEERERMLRIYPLPEEMWIQWLHDESIHANDLSSKVATMELWAKSIAHEPGSITLWKGYIRFILQTWKQAAERAVAEGGDDESWAEIFTFELVNSVLSKAVRETMYNIPRSHEIWNKYCELQVLQLKAMSAPSANGKTEVVQKLYLDRLRIPHDDLDSTFSAYSSFVSNYLPNADYVEVMKAGNKIYQDAKKALESRQKFEFRLRNSYQQAEEGQNWSDYIEWETTRRNPDINLCQALYERCVLRYSMESTVWEEYMYFMLEKRGSEPVILPLLERATAHCQWSGTLWSHRILAFDVRQQPFESIERIKHQATESRLMITQSEIFKVHLAWCGVLKRRGVARDPMVADMDLVAELGIRSAMSEIESMDPDYRIARLLITFLTEKGDVVSAEDEWKTLAPSHANQYEFWLRYYGWAFRNTGNLNATEVLRKAAANWKDMDWPEKIIDMYHTQIEDHGMGSDIEGAMLHIRRLRKQVEKRRELEAAAAQPPEAAASPWSADAKGKRRRSNVEDDELPHKKARASEDIEMEPVSAAPVDVDIADDTTKDTEAAKENTKSRDRETLTVFAKNLPADVDESLIRKFFKGCGIINAINVLVEDDKESATASIEFQNSADVLAAQTRDKKVLNGREISIETDNRSTVYITNFPPVADEKWIRELLKDCGQILQVRFPSLKYNTHRRFCYVQFESSDGAGKATQFDGKDIEGFTIVSKLSNPDQKQDRSGAVYEGREVFVRNIDFNANEDDVRELFDKYGTIESIRLVRKGGGLHSGFGFVDFESAESAQASLELNEKVLKSRKLIVVMGLPQGGAPASKRSSGKTAPKAPNGTAGSPEATGSPMSIATSGQQDGPDRETIRQKTLYVLNVADTVNDSKIRAAFEKYGSLRKVQLRLDHQSAVVEFDDVKDAGKASMALDGHEIDGRAIKFGEYRDMIRTAPEKKSKPGDNLFATKKKQEQTTNPAAIVPTRVHRPTPAVRGGKSRVGIGFRPSSKSEKGEGTETDTNNSTKPKSNAEFRQIFLKGKAEAEDKE